MISLANTVNINIILRMLQSVNSNSVMNTNNKHGQVFEGSNFCYKADYSRS